MTEPLAWVVTVGAGLGTLFGIYVLTRPLRNGFLKTWLRCLSMVVLLLPAPVPGFDSYYAPAFLVVVFEAALQRDGEPALAAGLLVAGIVTATALVGGYFYLRRKWRPRG